MMIIVETEVGGDPTIPLVVERIDTDLYNVHVSNLFCHKDCGPTDTFRAMGYYIGHNGTDRAITIHREGGTYDVLVDGIVRHPGCTHEDVMRALGNYLMTANFSLDCDDCK